jgi:hypothetical protein
MSDTLIKVAQLKTVEAFRAKLDELGLSIPVDDRILTARDESPLAQSLMIGRCRVGNRWCIHPMEGWDANRDGTPSEHTVRRWRHFGISGAKLIWGGEAAAVQEDGRANPCQTLATEANRAGLSGCSQRYAWLIASVLAAKMTCWLVCNSRTQADTRSPSPDRYVRESRITIRCWIDE